MINKKKKDGTADVDQDGAALYKYVPAGLVKFCMPVSSIKLYEKNPRRNDIAVDELAKLIKMNMFRKPIVVDQHGIIRAGNTAYKAALRLGMKMIPVAQSDFNSEGAAVEYVISDNKIGEKSEWDLDVLKELMVAHSLADSTKRENTGFSEAEVNRLFDIKKETEKALRHTIEIAVTVESEETAQKLYERLTSEGYLCRVLTL